MVTPELQPVCKDPRFTYFDKSVLYFAVGYSMLLEIDKTHGLESIHDSISGLPLLRLRSRGKVLAEVN